MTRMILAASCSLLVFFEPVAYSLTQPNANHNHCYRRSSFSTRFASTFLTRPNRIVAYASETDFVDVEFERSEPGLEEADVYADEISEAADSDVDLSALLGTSKNLIDISLDSGDPRWKETRIPFCRHNEHIDCKLAFMVDLEGQSYGIGVPFDDVVAIVVQEKADKETNGRDEILETKNVDPDAYEDNEEYAELMEIFAGQVQEQLGEEFQLRKTPKVLTISGGLDKITKDWQNKVITKPFDVDELLEISKPKDEDDLNKELDSFYKFMRDELGDEEFEKTMNGEDDDDTLGEFNPLMDLFDVPDIDGTSEKDKETLEDLVESMSQDIETGEVSEANKFIPNTESAALKLLGYTFRESGKSYFLVKPLQPYTLVGRHVKDEDDIIRFELLTPEEDKIIIPKLEEMCREDLEANGLNFPSMDKTVKVED
eukprot:CAMPEP_0116139324 /NCGR_PEP_ID=MMETSP0329-20121206/13256_1 /TAXON_ID=697910 /ORGANISM="Pseudo-nitzschia arenysensis, Strain B593" /LENGTH=428 /DNA_ID=CAMNT_0003634369 /DNA_START=89 /DNA_END=1375 /DNA_ORIENTATION=+